MHSEATTFVLVDWGYVCMPKSGPVQSTMAPARSAMRQLVNTSTENNLQGRFVTMFSPSLQNLTISTEPNLSAADNWLASAACILQAFLIVSKAAWAPQDL